MGIFFFFTFFFLLLLLFFFFFLCEPERACVHFARGEVHLDTLTFVSVEHGFNNQSD